MVMTNFREMPYVKTLLVALVVLFALGAGVPGGVFARTEMANGHEGDPADGHDMVGGGSGGSADGESQPEAGKLESGLLISNSHGIQFLTEYEFVFQMYFDGQQLVFVAVVNDIFWRQK